MNNLTLLSGALSGTGAVRRERRFACRDGTISGSGDLTLTGTTTISGSVVVSQRPTVNTGTVNMTGSGGCT